MRHNRFIHQTDFYKELLKEYEDKEEMNEDTYNVVREEFFNLEALDNIEKQKHLLNSYEQFILSILQTGLKVSNFHIGGISPFAYWTSVKCNYDRHSWSSNEFDCFKNGEPFNNRYKNVFISRINMFDDVLFLEHNEQFSEEQISMLQVFVNKLNEEYNKTLVQISKIKKDNV